jgi:hypothetical protein
MQQIRLYINVEQGAITEYMYFRKACVVAQQKKQKAQLRAAAVRSNPQISPHSQYKGVELIRH